MSAISVRNVSKVWGSVKAVDGVSFEAAGGKLVVLLGPSGCGKSTTLRLIAGLEHVADGRILIGNEDVTELPPAARHIAMVFGRTHKVMQPGIIEWGTTPKDFFEKKMAMMWTTTGNLTNVKNNAKFDFGVAMLPANKRRGSPTGGGNFYLFKKNTPAQNAATLKFIKWLTTPERAAEWGIATGYVAVRQDAWETPAMKKYVAGFPAAAVARDQLPYAVAELSTHENQRVTKALNDGLQAALTGAKPAAQAMKEAQAEAERILRSYRR